MTPKPASVAITCGVGGCDIVTRGRTAREARANMKGHRTSAHPGYKPQKGSIIDRRKRLD